MEHRVRAAAILIEEGKILLVKHFDPRSGDSWWIPPGGGLLPEDDSILECAKREVYEETGLSITLGKLVYLREFRERETSVHHLELFFFANDYSGTLTTEYLVETDPDKELIQELAWLSPIELKDLVVYPEILVDEFWRDLRDGFSQFRYLGVHYN
jgi:ADP-ribose pyrophosphatase YjhB (NUDIX family)